MINEAEKVTYNFYKNKGYIVEKINAYHQKGMPDFLVYSENNKKNSFYVETKAMGQTLSFAQEIRIKKLIGENKKVYLAKYNKYENVLSVYKITNEIEFLLENNNKTTSDLKRNPPYALKKISVSKRKVPRYKVILECNKCKSKEQSSGWTGTSIARYKKEPHRLCDSPICKNSMNRLLIKKQRAEEMKKNGT